MNLKNCLLHLTALALLPVGLANGETIASTTFDGQVINGNTASDLGWTVNGVEDPGSISALIGDTATEQELFNSNLFNQSLFAPRLNTGNENTWWRTSVDLTATAASTVSLTDVTFDYWAINSGGAQNVARLSDFRITLYNPSNEVVGTASVFDVSNSSPAGGNGISTAVSIPFSAPVALSTPGTYRLEIDGGDFGGVDETGNHTGIDNLSINGTTGSDLGPQIIGIEGFDYPDGPIADKAGGTFWDWDNTSLSHTSTFSDWDTLFGSVNVVDGKLQTSSTSAAYRQFNGPEEGASSTNDEGLGAIRASSEVYFQTTMTRTAGSGWSGISSYDFATERILFGILAESGKFGIQVLNSDGLDGVSPSAIDPVQNQAYVIVGKIDFSNNLLSLWVNPDLGDFEANNSADVTRSYDAPFWSTAVGLGSGSGTTATWDNLEVALAWEDLTDTVPPVVEPPVVPSVIADTLLIDSLEFGEGDSVNISFADTTLGVKNYMLKQSPAMRAGTWTTVPGTTTILDPDTTAGHRSMFSTQLNPSVLGRLFLRVETAFKDPNDWDLDGQTNSQEASPRNISYTDENGNVVTVNGITSDPLKPDSDDDGVDDATERNLGTNSQSSDTDRDNLSDGDEQNRYGSDPRKTDSDGDGDIDGAEVNIYGTSPILVDTDGDAEEDPDERSDFTSPLISQVPVPFIDIDTDTIRLSLDLTFTEGSDQVVETTLGRNTGQETTLGMTDGRSVETTTETSAELSVGVEATAGVPPSASVSVTGTIGSSQALSSGRNWSVDKSSTRSSQESYEEALGLTSSESFSTAGGKIRLTLKVVNRGQKTFAMNGLTLTAFYRDPTISDPASGKQVLGTLEFASPNQLNVTLAPGAQSGPLAFEVDIDTIAAQQLSRWEGALRDPSLLSFEVANFGLLDREGIDFAFLTEKTLLRTALLVIDYGGAGGRDVETYRVAANVERNGNQPAGVALRTVLTDDRYLDIPFTTGMNPVRGEVLTGIRGVNTINPTATSNGAFWAIASTDPAVDDPTDMNDFTPFDEVVLLPNQEYYLMYVRDMDKDGLWAREEAVLGSSDSDTNSDSDTLDDFAEAREGWNVSVVGKATYKAFSDPSDEDVDQDGVLDHEEKAAGTDPRLSDTDGDGRSDRLEIDDNPNFLNPLDPSDPSPAAINLSPENPIPDAGNVTIAGNASDPEEGLQGNITITVSGFSPRVIAASGTSQSFSESYAFTTTGNKTFTIQATNTNGQVTTKTVTVNITTIFPTSGLVNEYLFNSYTGNTVIDTSPTATDNGRVDNTSLVTNTGNRFGRSNAAIELDDSQIVDDAFPTIDLRAPTTMISSLGQCGSSQHPAAI